MISFAAQLKRRSPSMSYGHGWILGDNGKRWHPVKEVSSAPQIQATPKRGKSWLSKAIQCLSN
ncbi:phage filamentation protein Fil family protein [Pantoea sp. BRR-3P]|uniref:phage filamentation protein Fil family protein n=1 Tax=Pantoea sp. BRR-3P TaxID=3141541 RepID=UPI0031F4E73E